jgi:hypothetical protein
LCGDNIKFRGRGEGDRVVNGQQYAGAAIVGARHPRVEVGVALPCKATPTLRVWKPSLREDGDVGGETVQKVLRVLLSGVEAANIMREHA